jgi:hypothetical protein
MWATKVKAKVIPESHPLHRNAKLLHLKLFFILSMLWIALLGEIKRYITYTDLKFLLCYHILLWNHYCLQQIILLDIIRHKTNFAIITYNICYIFLMIVVTWLYDSHEQWPDPLQRWSHPLQGDSNIYYRALHNSLQFSFSKTSVWSCCMMWTNVTFHLSTTNLYCTPSRLMCRCRVSRMWHKGNMSSGNWWS